jgi:hypothetical protein
MSSGRFKRESKGDRVMTNGSQSHRAGPAAVRLPSIRGVLGVILLIAATAAATLQLGCATGEKRDSVWVQIIPGRFYTFQGVKGETDGETLFVTGKIEAVGYFERGYVPFIVTGRGPEGEIVVEKESGTWMKSRRESFYTQIPYKPHVDYTIRAGREGLVSKIR